MAEEEDPAVELEKLLGGVMMAMGSIVRPLLTENIRQALTPYVASNLLDDAAEAVVERVMPAFNVDDI